MSRSTIVLTIAMIAAARAVPAQSTASYRERVDSLAKQWRPLEAEEERQTVRRASPELPQDSIEVAPIIVRTESTYVGISRQAASHLSARVQKAYGSFSSRVARYQFFVRYARSSEQGTVVATGVADSLGVLRQRSSVFADADALEHSWAQKAEEIVTDELNPSVRSWAGSVIPIDPPTAETWRQARVDLFLASADAARQCSNGNHARCLQVLELEPVENPAFVYLTADQRRMMVINNGRLIRRADPAEFDRCAEQRDLATCDSLALMVPSDAVPRPLPPSVRQSFVRFALMIGGQGAFDRFAAAGPTIRSRIEAASGLSADSVVDGWRAAINDARTTSTTLDFRTALASMFWIGVCTCLALRSSRWR